MDTRAAGVPSGAVAPLMPLAPSVAVMVVVPTAMLLARPRLPEVLLTTATDGFEELHVTEVVRSWVVPLLYVPMAVNCWLVPSAMEGLVGGASRGVRTGTWARR